MPFTRRSSARTRAPMRPAAILTVAIALLAANDAHAQAPDAEAIIRHGVELREQGHDDTALVEFRRAWDLSQSGRARAQMALAELGLGRWLDADAHMREALATTHPWVRTNRTALERAQRTIESHVGGVEISGNVQGAEVRINGEPIGSLPMTAPARVVAGTVTLEVRAEGHYPVSRSLIVPPGGLARESVTLNPIPVVAAPVVTPAVPVEAAAAPVRTETPAPQEEPRVSTGAERATAPHANTSEGGSIRGLLGAVVLGAGIAGLAVGGISAVIREGYVRTFNNTEGCFILVTGMVAGDEICRGEYARGRVAETLSAAGFVAGGVFAIVGALLMATAPSSRQERSARAWVRCAPSFGSLGVSCGGAF